VTADQPDRNYPAAAPRGIAFAAMSGMGPLRRKAGPNGVVTIRLRPTVLRDAWVARVTWIAPGERRKVTKAVEAPTMFATGLLVNRLERQLRKRWAAEAAARQRRWYRRRRSAGRVNSG
jgi:hypothetical protein